MNGRLASLTRDHPACSCRYCARMQAEHINPLQLPSNGPTGQIYTMLARDQGTPVHASGGNTNLYASQPFYLVHDPVTGEAFGVFLFNSNAMGEWGPTITSHWQSTTPHPCSATHSHLRSCTCRVCCCRRPAPAVEPVRHGRGGLGCGHVPRAGRRVSAARASGWLLRRCCCSAACIHPVAAPCIGVCY